MVATLFVGRLPWNFKEDDLIALFGSFSGFQSARLRTNKWNNLVAFVDFNNFENAERAKENLQGYKLDKDQKGLFIQYSHSSPTTIPLKSLGNGIIQCNGISEVNHSDLFKSFMEPIEFSSTKTRETTNPMNPSRSTISSSHYSRNDNTSLKSFIAPTTISPAASFPNSTLNHVGASQSMFPDLPPFLSVTHSNMLSPQYENHSDQKATLFVEGIPIDATEREISHIFRQWPGYKSVRIISTHSKLSPSRTHFLCFVEFDSKPHATIAMQYLQGYKVDIADLKGLSISFAKSERKQKIRSVF